MIPTVGQQLRSAREKMGISIQDAARETHIRVNYLQELENDHPEQLQSVAQARGFLRLYAAFLDLSYQDLLSLWDVPAEEPSPQAEQPEKKEGRFAWLGRRAPAEKDSVSEPETPAEEIMPEVQEPPAAELPEQQPETLAYEVDETRSVIPEEEQPQEEADAEEALLDEQEEQEIEAEAAPEEGEKPPSRVKAIISGFAARLAGIPFLKKVFKLKDPSQDEGDAAEEQAEPARTSQDIFKEIGAALLARRQMMDLNLSDIENFTNLKRTFLVAIEDGRFDDLPSTVQGRGMLNNYAKFLGMEESIVMDMYGSALQLQREERLKPQRKQVQSPVSVKVNLPDKWRRIINPDLIIGSALIIGLFVFIIWGASQVFGNAEGSPTEAPSISEMLQMTPSLSPSPDLTLTGEAGELTQEATPLPGVAVVESTPTVIATVNAAPLQLYILAHDRAYLRVTVDGQEAFDGRVSPDNVYTYSGNESIELLTGNAYALEIYFNQEYIGSLGKVGEVANIDFTLDGLIEPTPQQTQTSTPEPGPEAMLEDEAMTQ
jgi:cytoskeletal protein RodZ